TRLGDGATMDFKQQQMIEIVPWFLQENDDPLAYAQIAHLLRSSPAWSTGNTVMPYPIHLGQALLKDMLPLLGVEPDDEDESDD
ncbi:MAG TPA: RNaseH domain-containing protein, partial [Clostridia bacterium]|nr:RNaseH domain-containing protein [Clostridia bacterium]